MVKKLFIPLFLFATLHLFGAEITNVIDAFDGNDPFDANIEFKYYYKYQSTKIKREYFCNGSDDINCAYDKMGNSGIINANNFLYKRKDHVIEPKLKFGLYKDLEMYFALPIHLSSNRNLGFDSTAKKAAQDTNRDGKIDASDGTPTHNGASNTFWNIARTGNQDLFLPYKYQKNWDTTGTGNDVIFDENFPNSGLDYDRSGLSTLNIGMNYDILENNRDDTDPTWRVGFEYRAAIVSPQELYSAERIEQIGNGSGYGPYDASELQSILSKRIDLTDGMGDGIHYLNFETALSKRYGFADPFVSFYYTQSFVFNNSALKENENRKYYKPGDVFGFNFGLEIVPWEISKTDEVTGQKNVKGNLAIELNFNFEHQSKGMMYSELTDYLAIPTVVSEYSTIGGGLTLRFMPINYVKLNLGVLFGYSTDHYLTDQPRGVDHDGNGTYSNDEYDPMYHSGDNYYSEENMANRTYFNSINAVGNRILATETFIFAFNFLLQVQF